MSKFSCQEFPERLLLIRQDKPSCSLVKQSELRNKDEWAKFLRLPFGFGSGLDRQSSLRGLWEDSHEQLRQFRPFQGNLELGRARSCQQGVRSCAYCLPASANTPLTHHAHAPLPLSHSSLAQHVCTRIMMRENGLPPTRAACVHMRPSVCVRRGIPK